MIARVE